MTVPDYTTDPHTWYILNPKPPPARRSSFLESFQTLKADASQNVGLHIHTPKFMCTLHTRSASARLKPQNIMTTVPQN